MRGRSRKGSNPLNKSYESNGPDVKIRGTALHIAEKYAQMARDLQASGDRIVAENYLQHSEHYYRLIAAAQPQPSQQTQPTNQQDREAEPASDTETTETANTPIPGNGADAVMPDDAPQPFVEVAPDAQLASRNGADESQPPITETTPSSGDEAGDSEDGANRPRRRTRGTRGRGTRRAIPKIAEAGDGAPAENAAPADKAAADKAPSDTGADTSSKTPVEPAATEVQDVPTPAGDS